MAYINDVPMRCTNLFLMALAIFLFSLPAHALQRISQRPDGTGGNERSFASSISGDGSAIVFDSYANNLVDNDDPPEALGNIFLWRRDTNSLQSLTADPNDRTVVEGRDPDISSNGRYVVYLRTWLVYPGPTNTEAIVFHDRDVDQDGILDEPGAVGDIAIPLLNLQQTPIFGSLRISGDGRQAVFVRQIATQRNPNNGLNDLELAIFLCDRDAGTLDQITAIPSELAEAIREEGTGTTYNHFLSVVDISADGRFILFERRGIAVTPSDPPQAYVLDRFLNQTILISKNASGDPADQGATPVAMSGDGRFVLFDSNSGNLVNNPNPRLYPKFVFLADRDANENGVLDDTPDNIPSLSVVSIRVSGDWVPGAVEGEDVSSDGNLVLFATPAINGDPNSTTTAGNKQLFLHNRNRGTTTLVTLGINGAEGNGTSEDGVLSDDGRFASFNSYATNLVVNDINNFPDVFSTAIGGPTHTLCQGTRCAEVPGEGPLLCFSDRECTAMHLDCTRSGQCVEVPGTGSNLCQTDANCPPMSQQHLACVNQSCTHVEGGGPNTCATDNDCVTHTACTRDGACAVVMGTGTNGCATNADCAGHTTCTQEGQCVSVASAGVNDCRVDADCAIEPPPTGPTYACSDSDGGDRAAQMGTAKVMQDGRRTVAWNWDYCCQSYLKEFYCRQGSIQNRWYLCKNCSEGRCVDEAASVAENAVPQQCKTLAVLSPSGQRTMKRVLQKYYQGLQDRIRGLF